MDTSVTNGSGASAGTDGIQQREGLPPVAHDILLRAARGEMTPHAPVWAMRQAGRYLPEFRAMRAKADFFTMCNTPELCAEATLQPLRRFPSLDAVVIFSDILIVPQAMGMQVLMAPGPIFPKPLKSPADIEGLVLKPDCDAAFARLYEGITLTRRLAAETVRPVPVIGFCGGPWTLMGYMIDSGPKAEPAAAAAPSASADAPPKPLPTMKEEKDHAKRWLYQHPEASHRLLDAIADVCIELLVGQWRAGASILQVFESSGGDVPPHQFREFALPYLLKIAKGVRARVPGVSNGGPPIICFPRCVHNPSIIAALCGGDSCFDLIGLDWNWDPREALDLITSSCTSANTKLRGVQGNLDPTALYAPKAVLVKEVMRMLKGFGTHPIVCNLGHGMAPSHDPAQLAVFFDAVHEISKRLRAGEEVTDEDIDAMLPSLGKMHVPAGF